jgi:hypothetical protein
MWSNSHYDVTSRDYSQKLIRGHDRSDNHSQTRTSRRHCWERYIERWSEELPNVRNFNFFTVMKESNSVTWIDSPLWQSSWNEQHSMSIFQRISHSLLNITGMMFFLHSLCDLLVHPFCWYVHWANEFSDNTSKTFWIILQIELTRKNWLISFPGLKLALKLRKEISLNLRICLNIVLFTYAIHPRCESYIIDDITERIQPACRTPYTPLWEKFSKVTRISYLAFTRTSREVH